MTALSENNFRPESHYKDTGCRDAGVTSCLDCPLPKCVEEMSASERAVFRRERKWREWARTIRAESLPVEEAAERFGVTVRTIYRVKRACKAGGNYGHR